MLIPEKDQRELLALTAARKAADAHVLVSLAVSNAMPRGPGEHPRWAAVADAFDIGKDEAEQLCRRHNLNPEDLLPGPHCPSSRQKEVEEQPPATKPKSVPMRCDKCLYWVCHEEADMHPDDYEGKCHRYPAVLDSVYAGKLEDDTGEGCEARVSCWQQPLTVACDWCGEFAGQSGVNSSPGLADCSLNRQDQPPMAFSVPASGGVDAASQVALVMSTVSGLNDLAENAYTAAQNSMEALTNIEIDFTPVVVGDCDC